jgi:pantetheine-phosphate adenylyltransferase
MTDYKWFYTSSTIIKEAASLGGDVSGLVPPVVCRKLKEKFGY